MNNIIISIPCWWKDWSIAFISVGRRYNSMLNRRLQEASTIWQNLWMHSSVTDLPLVHFWWCNHQVLSCDLFLETEWLISLECWPDLVGQLIRWLCPPPPPLRHGLTSLILKMGQRGRTGIQHIGCDPSTIFEMVATTLYSHVAFHAAKFCLVEPVDWEPHSSSPQQHTRGRGSW